jgi:hypothetical protein
MEPKKNAPEETVKELCKRIDSDQDLEKLLDLASKIWRLEDARRPPKKPLLR